LAKQLLVIAGPDEGRLFPLEEGDALSMGRGRSAAVCLSDPAVSPLHCRVRAHHNQILIVDCDSECGTFVNGHRVMSHELRPGDVLRIGQTHVCLVTGGSEEQTTTEPEPAPLKESPPRVAAMSEMVGKSLNRYELRRLTATGQLGVIFQARDPKKDQFVALKVLWPEVAAGEVDKRRFVRAMRTVIPLRHPNLVTVYNAGKTGPLYWIAMEYIIGSSLSDVIKRISATTSPASGPRRALSQGLPRGWWLFALRVAVHVGRALEFAHAHQIVHRNITPRNILVRDEDNIAKLGDLMLAKALEGPLAEDITHLGEVPGELRYMCPERTFRSEGGDGRSDIYSLGATVYALLTGRAPFVGPSLKETLDQIREANPVPPTAYRPSIPVAFERAILKMLSKLPEDRFQTPAELLSHLEHIAEHEGLKL
jgi:serine/threonine protein kinase